jgi:hypothetical protein
MNYKETFYFIATCLTISSEKHNKQAIEKQLKENKVDWDAVVKVSTRHFVFPALYCVLKREDFLQHLPQELVNYMELITNLNRKRNEQIITQAKELNTFLLAHNITPVFLKGTGNLFAGLYKDIAERMIGDIDFIFSKEAYPKAIKLLRNYGYSDVLKERYHFPSQHHYRRLKKEHHISAIEIHKELSLKKYTNEFNYAFVKKDCQIINDVAVLSYANKLNVSIVTSQITDNIFYYKTINLRNAYDVFLISKKTNAKQAVNTVNKLRHPLNCFIAACYEVFNQVASLEYHKTEKTTAYLNTFKSQFINTEKTTRKHQIIKTYLDIKLLLSTLYRCLLYKEYRIWLFYRVTDKKWYNEKLIQLGLKR